MDRVLLAANPIILALVLFLLAWPSFASEERKALHAQPSAFGFETTGSLFKNATGTLFTGTRSDSGLPAVAKAGSTERNYLLSSGWERSSASLPSWSFDPSSGSLQLASANMAPVMYPDTLSLSYQDKPTRSPYELEPNDRMFFKGWVLITGVEVALLAVTASLPKSWTGWSSTFVQDGLGNLRNAYTGPPVWDTDHWFHNYIGHPYGGSVYYNTVRCQGAKKGQSFLFSMALSLQWEYFFEAFAEQPSIQDLFITPVFGSLLGEFVHRVTVSLKKNGTSFGEKVIITILNPTSVVFNGYH
jgi:hypothetical protein